MRWKLVSESPDAARNLRRAHRAHEGNKHRKNVLHRKLRAMSIRAQRKGVS